jgi:hypothetical protein
MTGSPYVRSARLRAKISSLFVGAVDVEARSAGSACPKPVPPTIRAHVVRPITAVRTEYSLWTRDPEAGQDFESTTIAAPLQKVRRKYQRVQRPHLPERSIGA